MFRRNLRVDWDIDYGIDRRTGWSIHYDGTCLVVLEPSLLRAIFLARREWRSILAWRRLDARRRGTGS